MGPDNVYTGNELFNLGCLYIALSFVSCVNLTGVTSWWGMGSPKVGLWT